MNDAKALALLKSGDQEALEWFIDKYSAYVGTVVNSILASSMTHEDGGCRCCLWTRTFLS